VKTQAVQYIGIDPGKSGGLSLLGCLDGKYVKVFSVDAMPKTERDIADWFEQASSGPVFATIEKVHAMPGNGVSSMFKFGQGYGFLRACLICHEIPFEEVTPMMWQKSLGIPKRSKTESSTQFKNRLKAHAQQLFPSVRMTLANCDGLLIAEYNRRKRENVL